MSFEKLDQLCRTLDALDHALAILGADEATHMAVGGGEARAEAMATLAGMHHRQATAPEIGDWIDAAENEALNEEQQGALREFKRRHVNLTCLPADFVERQTRTRMRCEQLWRDLRAKNDWAGFQPALEGVVALVREEGAMRADALGLDPYDALMEQYDPGNRVAEVGPILEDLKVFLVDFVPKALAVQEKRLVEHPLKPLSGTYPIEHQRELGLAMMAAVGFDVTHGSLSVSHHPFCGGVPTDVRITTRYRTSEFLSSLMGVLHETGHALYEQGLPREWAHWPFGKARGMAIHESQSLFVEKQIGRNPAFWRWALPVVERHLGEEWSIDDILPHIHRVERGLIRVDADEVTYPLHVILRFELEQELVSGRLEVVDLPEAWDAKMQSYLGLSTIDNPADGPMQDVHWPSAAFGYFPSRRNDCGATMGRHREGVSGHRGRLRPGSLRQGQRVAQQPHLVAGLALVDARTHRARDRRTAQRGAFSSASGETLRRVISSRRFTKSRAEAFNFFQPWRERQDLRAFDRVEAA